MLADSDVVFMRMLYTTAQVWFPRSGGSAFGYGKLAKMFGCGQSTVRDIVLLRTRTDV